MAVFTLEDAAGRRGGDHVSRRRLGAPTALIEVGAMLLVSGKLERDDEVARIVASEIVPIDTVRERLAREVAIRVTGPLG